MQPTLILCRDLMFSSKITATARGTGAAIELLRDPKQLPDRAGDRLIVDLNQPDALTAAMQWRSLSDNREVFGFVSHMDAETIKAASAAGVDRILARSQFVTLLPELLQP